MAVTVLVVEDERKLRDLVRSYLERAGFTVLSTGSGAEAITLASGAAPDLVVLDLRLPDVPGETVARELRAATVRGAVAELTPTEWGVLVALATVPGRVYSRFELINRVRGYEFEGYERTVDSHVKNLRRKIEEDPASPRIIQTVLGGGYRLGLARDA
jgi:DNA-binding response OmpR family regulator